MTSLYERDGDAFVGTPITTGGWSKDAQSGGAALALLGHVLDEVPSLTPMSVTRFTADLVRPVPIGKRLWVDVSVIREGKKIQVVDLLVRSDETEHVRARALRVRDADLRGTEGAPGSSTDFDPGTLLPSPDDLSGDEPGLPKFLRVAMDFRRTDPDADGVNGLWLRLRVPVVADEPVRPTSRATVPMDLVNLIGAKFGGQGFTAINPDVSAHLARPPVGEWVGLVGETIFAHDVGHGVSAATISDERGVLGITSTSQLVEHIPTKRSNP